MRLKPGMVVCDRRGRPMKLMGRNGCNQHEWWGHRLKPNGRPDRKTMPTVMDRDVVAIRMKYGFQMVFQGIFG